MNRVDVTTADPARIGALRLDAEPDHERIAPAGVPMRRSFFALDAVYGVAWAFQNAPNSDHDSFVVAAHRELQDPTDRMFSALTDPDLAEPNLIVFTSILEPYASDQALIDSVRTTRTLEVSAAPSTPDRLHPLLSCDVGGPDDRFRAVHDVLGHVRTGLGFDRYDEFAAWRVQDLQ
jgi:hypothetical protein